MLDIRLIREQPDLVKSRLAMRGGGDEAKVDELLRVDAERRKAETALQQLNADRKRLSKEIGAKRSRGETAEEFEAQVRQIGQQITELSEHTTKLDEQQRNLLLEIPNLPHESVPVGKDPSANRVVRSWGEKPNPTGKILDHVAIGEERGLFDLERAAALETVHGYLKDIGINYCGRYGDWGYMWTDESYISGERAAESALSLCFA